MWVARGDVFGKQAKFVFAEFLPHLLIFLEMLLCKFNGCLCMVFLKGCYIPLSDGPVIISDWFNLMYTCIKRSSFLVTSSNINFFIIV